MSKKFKHAKSIIAAGVIGAAVLGFIVYQTTAPVEAKHKKVEKGTATLSFSEVGDVTAGKSVLVHSLSSGKVLSVDVMEGQYVEKGEVICTLDPWEYENTLSQSGNTSSEVALLRKNIDNCTITAPISGVITSLPAKDTDFMPSEMEVATIESKDNMKIEVMINTTDIAYVSVDTPVDLVLRRRDGDVKLTGVVTAIDSMASVEISAKGNKERLVKVTVKPDDMEALEIGYDVDVQFKYYNEEDQLKVPKSAVFDEEDKSYVWKVADDKLEKTEIEIKKTLRSEIVIKEGLSQGDSVVTDALADGLKEGKGVK